VAGEYDPKIDPKRRPANSKDPGKECGYSEDLMEQDKVTCKLCNKRIAGGIKRFKKHLTGGNGDVLLCSMVGTEVRKKMSEYLDANNNAEDREQDEDENEFDD